MTANNRAPYVGAICLLIDLAAPASIESSEAYTLAPVNLIGT
jgi:hypothetical protein